LAPARAANNRLDSTQFRTMNGRLGRDVLMPSPPQGVRSTTFRNWLLMPRGSTARRRS
jgi:hypothetical protein